MNGLLNVNELADALGHHRSYVTDMKNAGFEMPGGRATLEEGRQWLRDNPHFRTGRRKKKSREVRVL
jgi:hypothetical protein